MSKKSNIWASLLFFFFLWLILDLASVFLRMSCNFFLETEHIKYYGLKITSDFPLPQRFVLLFLFIYFFLEVILVSFCKACIFCHVWPLKLLNLFSGQLMLRQRFPKVPEPVALPLFAKGLSNTGTESLQLCWAFISSFAEPKCLPEVSFEGFLRSLLVILIVLYIYDLLDSQEYFKAFKRLLWISHPPDFKFFISSNWCCCLRQLQC